ncbi:MAG TPA: NAD(P)/FAD-dependent oxidoreductase [Rubrobacter sp.]
MDAVLDTVVVGAGPAGLAVAGCLRARGSSFELLERSHRLAEAWHERYESLWLHTDKRHSELPGLAYPKRYPRYVPKGQFLAYLETFVQRFDLHPRWGEEAVSARRVGELWELRTASSVYRARNLVVATGHASRPNWPGWPGFDSFHGPVVHSSRYRNPLPYVGKRVLVVGFGNSGGRSPRISTRAGPTLPSRCAVP